MRAKLITLISVLFSLTVATIFPATAHVSISPKESDISKSDTFTVSVPNEKNNPTIAIRLAIPDAVESVTPHVKAGWKISMKKNDKGKVVEITWNEGNIPVGMRDEFTFRAKMPAKEEKLVWKAYQTYSDNVTVSWDQDPTKLEDKDEENPSKGPYVETSVKNDIKTEDSWFMKTVKNPIVISYIALFMSALAILINLANRPKQDI